MLPAVVMALVSIPLPLPFWGWQDPYSFGIENKNRTPDGCVGQLNGSLGRPHSPGTGSQCNVKGDLWQGARRGILRHLAGGTVDAGTEGKISKDKVICAILMGHTTESYYQSSRIELQCFAKCSGGRTMINVGFESLNNGNRCSLGDDAALQCGSGKGRHR